MKASKLRLEDLPSLNGFTPTGPKKLCYRRQTGICPFGDQCKAAASHGEKATDQFATSLINVIKGGVDDLMTNGLTHSKRKRS